MALTWHGQGCKRPNDEFQFQLNIIPLYHNICSQPIIRDRFRFGLKLKISIVPLSLWPHIGALLLSNYLISKTGFRGEVRLWMHSKMTHPVEANLILLIFLCPSGQPLAKYFPSTMSGITELLSYHCHIIFPHKALTTSRRAFSLIKGRPEKMKIIASAFPLELRLFIIIWINQNKIKIKIKLVCFANPKNMRGAFVKKG